MPMGLFRSNGKSSSADPLEQECAAISINSVRLGWRMITRFSSDRECALRLGVNLLLEPLAMYYLVLELADVRPDDASRAGLDRLFWLWSQYVLVGDAILDEYGPILPPSSLQESLAEFDRTGVLRIVFGGSGPSLAELTSLPHSLAVKGDCRDRLALVNDFHLRIDELLSQRVADPLRRQSIRTALNEATRNMFLSYVIERRIGLHASIDQMMELLSARTDASAMVDVASLMAGRQAKGESLACGRRFLRTAVLCLQIIDEIKDVQADYEKQPNLVVSLATHTYPKEGRRIERGLEAGRLGGWFGKITLLMLAPKTVLRAASLFFKHMLELGRLHPSSATICLVVYLSFALLRSDGSRGASMTHAN